MRTTFVTALLILTISLLAACSEKATAPSQVGTIIVVSNTTYTMGSSIIESKAELLALVKATPIREPVVVNWSIQSGSDATRTLVESRAEEIRKILIEAGISVAAVAAVAVGNEIFGAKE